MHKYLLLLLILTSAQAAISQSVFNSGDPTIAFSSGAAVGSPSHPDTPATGTMVKWVRTRNTSRINWDDTKFKCYYHSGMSFRLRYPQSYDSTKKYPLILFFHGAGESSTNIYENEDQLFWGAQMFESMITSGQFNGFLLFPQQAGAGWDDNWFPRVNDILDSLTASKGLDPDRVITMGLSEGGYGSINMASLYPQRVASVVSSSPILVNHIGNISNYIHVPVWFSNGGTDTGPDPSSANAYYLDFHGAGGNVLQSFYATGDHVTWSTEWGMVDANNKSLMAQWWNNASKTQPLVYYQNDHFCAGSPISARMGITAGFYAYQWQYGVSGNGPFYDIPGATGNEYTATRAGSYRVHFQRTSTSNWSDWTPNPVDIITKPCSLDTVYAEHFDIDFPNQDASVYSAYKKYNFTCMNGIYTTGTELFVNDATGRQGGRFELNYTNSGSSCTYTGTNKMWGTYPLVPTVNYGTNYLFSYYVANQTSSNHPVLVPTVNGQNLTLLSKPTTLPSSIGNTSWTKFTYLWNSGGFSWADLAMYNTNLGTNGNDFLLDEISLTRQLAPGGVTGMALWAKADAVSEPDSTKLVDWANSTGSTPLVQLAFGNKPLYKNNATDNINFNPLVAFNKPNDLQLNAIGGFAGTAKHFGTHMFMVARSVDSVQTDTAMIERGTPGSSNRMAIIIPIKGNVTFESGSTTGNGHLTYPADYGDLNKPVLWTFSKDSLNLTASGNKQDIRKNGITVAATQTAGSVFTGNNNNFKVGSSNVKIAEAIYYLDANITPALQNQIESYLAVKYGLTLGTALSPVNYTSYNGQVFWPGAQPGYAVYQHDVFGIGADTVSGLNQVISNSLNSGSGDGTGQVNKGNLILQAGSPLADRNYLMIGNDSGTLAEHIIIPGEAPTGVQTAKRVGREWKVINTGGVGSVTLTFDTTGLTLAGGATPGNFALLMDSDGDGDFTTGTASLFYATSSTGKQITFSGVTLNNNSVFTIITQKPASSLPATWLGFTAQAVNGNALLNWQTSEEVNVDYYAVEHSTTGANFTVIGVKPANNGLSINNYSYTQQSLAAGTHYYRIRRVDRDGIYKYSDVKTIKISALNAVQIRPNPVTGSTLSLGISLQEAAQAVIQVVSIDGKVMLRNNTQLVQGVNTVNINVDAIPTGIYLVQVQMNNDAVTKKFIRTR